MKAVGADDDVSLDRAAVIEPACRGGRRTVDRREPFAELYRHAAPLQFADEQIVNRMARRVDRGMAVLLGQLELDVAEQRALRGAESHARCRRGPVRVSV